MSRILQRVSFEALILIVKLSGKWKINDEYILNPSAAAAMFSLQIYDHSYFHLIKKIFENINLISIQLFEATKYALYYHC